MSNITEVLLSSAADMANAVTKMVMAVVDAVPTGSTQTWPEDGNFEGEGTFFAVFADGVETITNTGHSRSLISFMNETKGLRAVVHVDSTGYRVYTP